MWKKTIQPSWMKKLDSGTNSTLVPGENDNYSPCGTKCTQCPASSGEVDNLSSSNRFDAVIHAPLSAATAHAAYAYFAHLDASLSVQPLRLQLCIISINVYREKLFFFYVPQNKDRLTIHRVNEKKASCGERQLCVLWSKEIEGKRQDEQKKSKIAHEKMDFFFSENW